MPDTPHGYRATAAWAAVATIAIATLAWHLPPDGFFSGDPGVKLIAARNAIDHPGRPFEIDLPRIAGRPARWMEHFFQPHGDHAHALQSPIFPVLAAPAIAAFGLRGAYLPGAVSFVLLVPILEAIRRRLLPDVSPALLGFFTVCVSPVLFYALEFWEHAPAVALLAGATALLVDREAHAGVAGTRVFAAGVLASIALLLRPEALWYMVGLVVALRPGRRAMTWLVAGVACVAGPFAVLNYAHSGTFLGPHASTNLAPLGVRWAATRLPRARLWLVPSTTAGILGLVLIGAGWVAHLAHRRRPYARIVALAGAGLVAGSAALGHLERDALWTAWPAGALVLACFACDRGRRVLLTTAGIATAAIILTSTHDGGAQWGARFLLISTPAFILLSAAAAHTFLQKDAPLRLVSAGLVVAIGVSGLAASRLAYRELRGSKRYYASIVRETAAFVPAGGYVVTDVWWFDQITAALYGRHTVLFAPGAATGRDIGRRLERAGVRSMVMVTTREARSTLDQALPATCFRITESRAIRERLLTFSRARCERGRRKDGPRQRPSTASSAIDQ